MDSPFLSYSNDELTREKLAERLGVRVVAAGSFTESLKLFGLPAAIDVITKKGDVLLLRGRDVHNRRLWKKFHAATGLDEPCYQLARTGEALTQQYKAWLLKSASERYHLIQREEHQAWFERVVCLVVISHIMRNKYELSTTHGVPAFVDLWVANEMVSLMQRGDALEETARLIHHIVRTPEKAQELIEQIYDLHAKRIQERPLIQREALPQLSEGIRPAFVDLLVRKSADDE